MTKTVSLKTIKPWELELNQAAYTKFGSLAKIVSLKEISGVESYAYISDIREDYTSTTHQQASTVKECQEKLKNCGFLGEDLFLSLDDVKIYHILKKELLEEKRRKEEEIELRKLQEQREDVDYNEEREVPRRDDMEDLKDQINQKFGWIFWLFMVPTFFSIIYLLTK